ncbi:HAUS augmin-like complex subunit 8 isoform X2 [Phascolarctos cinereus]|uniref:HAUS augmin-like complex subunit 8 isoform X2 n=1 Tax=Phascolarctos cinereus TaxID=38626 RepID=A0A6P5IS73_PHACI|nr:HAUS augmin-like complex subunit 8 isoform X2 [Phascolarctos cinereus]
MAERRFRPLGGSFSEAGPSVSVNPKAKGRRVPAGRIVESRYLQCEKKKVVKALASDTSINSSNGKQTESGKKSAVSQKGSTDTNQIEKDDLQSTLLEGHRAAPPDLDLSAINDKSIKKRTPQLTSKTNTAQNSKTPKKHNTVSPEDIKMMESQTLLLTLLAVKMKKHLAVMEEKEERNLIMLCEEKDRLQKKVQELKRKLLFHQKEQDMVDVLATQSELLAPFVAVSEGFKKDYKTFATALDSTRHELPMKSIHMEGDQDQFLDELQHQLSITQNLLAEITTDHLGDNAKVFDVLGEFKEVVRKKDIELKRSFVHVLNLSSEVSKEAALTNQEAWEETQGTQNLSQWYFNRQHSEDTPKDN